MNTLTRSLLCVGVAVASIGGGVLVSRALQSSDAPATVAVTEFDSPVLLQGDIKAGRAQSIPMITPVAVGDDPAIIEQLLEGPPEIAPEDVGPETGRPGGDTPVIGVATSPTIVIPDLGSAEPIDGDAPIDPATTVAGTDPGASDPPTSDLAAADTATTDSATTDIDGAPLDRPLYFDPMLGGLFWLPGIVFDTCAGATPGTPSPAECPAGYAGTLSGGPGALPPTPFMWGATGHYTTARPGDFPTVCPAGTPAAGPGQTALTIYSQTPLASLVIEWRPYGSSLVAQSLTVEPATLPGQGAAWASRLEIETFTRDTFGMIPRCIVIDRDPDTAYEVQLTAIDAYGRHVDANRTFTLTDATPGGRPPTSARVIGVQPIANVEAWTTPGGSVSFSTRVITDLADPTDRRCGSPVESSVYGFDGQQPNPSGVYDPVYNRKVVTTIDLPPGGVVLLCATIYDSNNTLRPLGTDTLLLQARTAQRPVITLEGLRINGGIKIPAQGLSATIQFPGDSRTINDGCSGSWQNDAEVSAGVRVQAPLWECTQAALPVDITGYAKVPVTITRRLSLPAEDRSQSWGIEVQVDRCDPACPERPAEWYEIPIPSSGGVLCGRSFWESDTACPQPTDGVAIVRVEYPIIDGAARWGTTTLIASTDRPISDPTAGEPTVYVSSNTEPAGDDWSNLTSTLSIISDRPVTISSIRLEDGVGDSGSACSLRNFPVTAPAATEFEIDVQLCAGTNMRATARVTDAAGAEYDKHLTFVYARLAMIPALSTSVEFLGGDDVPNFGWIYNFRVSLDGQSPTGYGWYNWSGPGTGGSCMALDGTTANNYGGAPMIRVYGGTLEVSVSMNITTGGETECSGDGLGAIEFNGSYTMAQVQSGEPMVMTTPPDARIQLRITLTPQATWRLTR